VVLRGGIDMTIDPEELETILEDLDFMVEIVRQNCGIVFFLECGSFCPQDQANIKKRNSRKGH